MRWGTSTFLAHRHALSRGDASHFRRPDLVSSSFFFFVILRPLACARMSSLIVVFHYAIAALKSFVRLRVDFTDVRVVFIWTLPFFDRLLLLALLLDLLDHPLSLSQPPLQVHYLLFE